MGHRQMEWGTNKFMKLFSKKSPKSNNPVGSRLQRKICRQPVAGGSLKNNTTTPDSPRLRHTRSHESLLFTHINLKQEERSISPVPSNVNYKEHGFKVTSSSSSVPYFCCKTSGERDRCVNNLKAMDVNSNCITRVDKSFSIFLMEAKGLTAKKRYFCELLLDGTQYAQTSSKTSSELCFWGEHFQFQYLPPVETITVNLHREEEKKKNKSTLVGTVHIHVRCVTSQSSYTEKWYQLHLQNNKNSLKNRTTLRIKCKFQKIEILPMEFYADFLQYIKDNYSMLCQVMEPVISVKAKEDMSTCMIKIMQKEGHAKHFLTDLLMLEFEKNDDANLLFRGNTLASKAMEAFMKLVAEKYLQDTLGQTIKSVIETNIDCEVDPMKISNMSLIQRQQNNLLSLVRTIWSQILMSHTYFPHELRRCFHLYRESMSICGKSNLFEKVISASIFLRFLCPAILSPSLFNITHEYPDERTSRNLTLIAKTLQTLANFTKFQDKEHFMEFMNEFIEEEQENMRTFLKQISSPLINKYHTDMTFDGDIDLGKQLSILETFLNETLNNDPNLFNSLCKNQRISVLQNILQVLDHRRNQDNNNYLVQGTSKPSTPIINTDMKYLQDITEINVESINKENLWLNDKSINADISDKTKKCNDSLKNITPSITIHSPATLGYLSSNAKDAPNTVQSSTSPLNAYLTGSRKPADNLDTADDYVLLSALENEEKVYYTPLAQSNSLSHLPSSPMNSRLNTILCGNCPNNNHHQHFHNHISQYRCRRPSLNKYLQYSEYNNILKTTKDKKHKSIIDNISNKKYPHSSLSEITTVNSIASQRLLSGNSSISSGTKIEKASTTFKTVSNNKIIVGKEVSSITSAIPLSVQNSLYELAPKYTNYFYNYSTPVKLAHSVETLHVSSQNAQSSSSPSSLEHPSLLNLRKYESSTKNIPRTNPHFSSPNQIEMSLSRLKHHQSLSDVDHDSCQKTENSDGSLTKDRRMLHSNSSFGNCYEYFSDEVTSNKVSSIRSIEKYEEEILFLKTELDKMHHKLISAEERMLQVNISVSPKQFSEHQTLGRICDQSEMISSKDQAPLYHKGTTFFQI